ncbi:hypothetical protein HKD37_02G003911 [Glycine soja]
MIEAIVSLSRDRALSEYHPLSEAAARLTSKRSLEGNLPCQHTLSASSAFPTRSLSLLALSTPGSLSQNPLTRAKRENGVKRTFEPERRVCLREKGKGAPKTPTFRRILGFRVHRGGGNIPTTLSLACRSTAIYIEELLSTKQLE